VSEEDGEYLLYAWRDAQPAALGYKTALLYYYLNGGVVDSIELHVYYGD